MPYAIRIFGIICANGLTLLRLGLAFYLFLVPVEEFLWIITIALASEFLDGQIARWLNAETTFGRLMDPVADKIFVLAMLLSLMLHQFFSLWQILLLLARDLLIIYAMAVGVLTHKWQRIKRLKPRWAGKIATSMQFVLLLNTFLHLIPALFSFDLVFWLTAGCSIWAALDYYQLYKKHAV